MTLKVVEVEVTEVDNDMSKVGESPGRSGLEAWK